MPQRTDYWPGYINYTVGKLEILKLRDDYREKVCDKILPGRLPRSTARGRLGSDQGHPP
jgi:hypothetical protein